MKRRLGILGGGQLGLMLARAAQPLGIQVVVLDPNPQAPAAVAAQHIVADFDDPKALATLAQCDWVTFEFENVPDDSVQRLAENAQVNPGAEALRVSQDRWIEKNKFAELGIGTAQFRRVDSLDDARASFAQLGPLLLKTRRFGYDGKGQALIRSENDLEGGWESLAGAPCIAEQLINFSRELSVIGCRSSRGEVAFYSVVENTHREGILRTTLAPAPDLTDKLVDEAQTMALKLMSALDYVGVIALELFCIDGKLLANEFAPRVHNSGHWTIEGAKFSQFENHVRAIAGLPLGSTALRTPSVMTNLIGRVPDSTAILRIPDAHLHDYGKQERAGRKVGHVTVLAEDMQTAQSCSKELEALL